MNWGSFSDSGSGGYAQFIQHIDTPIKTVLELGSRDLDEAKWFVNNLNCHVVSWECNPEAIQKCKTNHLGYKDTITLVEKAVWSESKELTFRPVVNGNLGASSVFKANPHYPYENAYQQTEITVPAMRVDEWWADKDIPAPELLCMDLQGAELEALKSMGDMLDSVQYVITEGQRKRLYFDTPLISDISGYLAQYGFELHSEKLVNDWFGDYFFVKK